MKWEVQLNGDTDDLRELAKSLTKDDLCITERNGQFFLETTRFSGLTTIEELRSAASDLLSILTGAVRLSLGGRTPLQIANIAKVREDGTRDIFGSMSATIQVKVSCGGKITRSDGTVEVINPADKVPIWVNVALKDLKDTSVKKALQLLGIYKHSWVSLYRLYEVIEEDVGGIDKIANEGWATKKAIKLFKRTANSPGAIGHLARHGKEYTTSPSDPMDLGEAVALVKVILHNWLRSK
jgi:hypothetical protein